MPYRRTSHHRTGRLAAALALLIAAPLAACTPSDQESSPQSASQAPSASASQSGGSSQASASSTAASPSPTQDESEATTPILGADAWTTAPSDKDAAPTSEGLVFHDLRAGDHEGFYRVVVEFSGSGDPGWFMSWAEQPVEQGRGLPLDVEGVAFLNLAITGTSMPLDDEQTSQYYSGPSNVAVGTLDVIEDGTFEDQTHIVIGMDDVREFQVGTLTDPVRVVIDVKK
jgi:hypothetical protein